MACVNCLHAIGGRCERHALDERQITPQTSMMPHVCPVCRGTRTVPAGFYSLFGSGGTNAAPEPCLSCDGSGIVWR